MSTVTFYKQAKSRAEAKYRTLKGLPLPSVNMDVPVGMADFEPGKQWPPSRVQQRSQRIETYERLYNGDITDFVADKTAANFVVPFFERIPTIVMSLIMSSDPEVDEVELIMMQRYLSTACLNAFRSGRAYIVRSGDMVWSPHTSAVYDGAEGEIYVVGTGTSIASTDGRPDYARIYRIDQGTSIVWEQKWKDNSLGAFLTMPAGEAGTYAICDRPPHDGAWGKSMYDSLIAPVAGLALRLSGVERIIEKNLHPITTMGVNQADINSFASQGSPAATKTSQVDFAAFQKEFRNAMDEDVLLLPKESAVGKVEWGASAMSAAFELISILKQSVSEMSGLPMNILNGEMVAASGISLDKWLIALSAETRTFIRVLHAGAEFVRGAPFVWPSYFEQDAAAPTMPESTPMEGAVNA